MAAAERSAAGGQAALAQLAGEGEFLAVGPWRFSPGVSSTQGSRWMPGGREERGASRLAELARADVRVPVAVGAERGLGVVEVQRADAPGAELAPGLGEHRAHPPRRADVIAAGEQVAGVQAHAQALAAAGGLQQRRELRQRAAERAAGAGGVLEVQLAALALGQRLGDRLAGAGDRARTSPVLAEPGCSTTPAAPIAWPTRSEWVSEASDFARMSGSSLAQLSR